MSKEKDLYQVSLKAVIKNNNGEILLLKALLNGSHAGYYDLPGGRIDKDEFTIPLTDILKREISEEVGNIDVVIKPTPVAVARHCIPGSMTKTGKDIHVLYILFEVEYKGGKIVISNEHTDFKWADFSKENPENLLSSGNLEGIKMYLAK
ncbi:MAG: NUDIX domain-containing protein [Patescibacteria group bacterium]|jgi:8-oxo-dGTP pyrophosphatase MutT (NUDIX family)